MEVDKDCHEFEQFVSYKYNQEIAETWFFILNKHNHIMLEYLLTHIFCPKQRKMQQLSLRVAFQYYIANILN